MLADGRAHSTGEQDVIVPLVGPDAPRPENHVNPRVVIPVPMVVTVREVHRVRSTIRVR
jgi:hypothetical protein